MKMNKIKFLVMIVGILLVSLLQAQNPDIEADSSDEYYVAAYIWPSNHDDPLGRKNLFLSLLVNVKIKLIMINNIKILI